MDVSQNDARQHLLQAEPFPRRMTNENEERRKTKDSGVLGQYEATAVKSL